MSVWIVQCIHENDGEITKIEKKMQKKTYIANREHRSNEDLSQHYNQTRSTIFINCCCDRVYVIFFFCTQNTKPIRIWGKCKSFELIFYLTPSIIYCPPSTSTTTTLIFGQVNHHHRPSFSLSTKWTVYITWIKHVLWADVQCADAPTIGGYVDRKSNHPLIPITQHNFAPHFSLNNYTWR